MDKTTKTENRGGAREGAGRKGLGNTKRVSICLTDELVPVFKQLGGAKWLRCELERVAEPARTLDTDQIDRDGDLSRKPNKLRHAEQPGKLDGNCPLCNFRQPKQYRQREFPKRL